jgi:hypothetical protein
VPPRPPVTAVGGNAALALAPLGCRAPLAWDNPHGLAPITVAASPARAPSERRAPVKEPTPLGLPALPQRSGYQVVQSVSGAWALPGDIKVSARRLQRPIRIGS